MDQFNFELDETVKIRISGELGSVVGRAEYTNSDPQYYVRYKSADGRGVESWWSEEALVKASDEEVAQLRSNLGEGGSLEG